MLSLHIEKRLKERGVVLDQQSENINNKNRYRSSALIYINKGRGGDAPLGGGVMFFSESKNCVPNFYRNKY